MVDQVLVFLAYIFLLRTLLEEGFRIEEVLEYVRAGVHDFFLP